MKKITAILSILIFTFCFLTGCTIDLSYGDEFDETVTVGSVSEAASDFDNFEGKVTISETTAEETTEKTIAETIAEKAIDENGSYTSKDEVAEYIHEYGRLPNNYITKKEAKALGWEKGDDLWDSAPGKSIGGDYFGNYEGILPEKEGRKYTECDIDSTGKRRSSKRIVFSNDGLIYYTEDHYNTFELLYGEE